MSERDSIYRKSIVKGRLVSPNPCDADMISMGFSLPARLVGGWGGCSEQGCVRRKPATITDRKKGIVSANRWIRMFNQTYEMAVYLISILDTQ